MYLLCCMTLQFKQVGGSSVVKVSNPLEQDIQLFEFVGVYFCKVQQREYSIYIFFPGNIQLNPPKPPVNVQPVDVGNFTRAVTGESFVVEADANSNFPPNKITDLSAELQEEIVHLNWTAPGADFDQGTGESG